MKMADAENELCNSTRQKTAAQVANNRIHPSVVAAIAAVFILSALAISPNSTVEAEDEYYQIGVGTVLVPDDFNPFSMTTGISYTVLWITYDFLYTAGPDMGPYPQLAHSHSTSEDGLEWTYYIREDAYWHDGEKVTANDVDFTFNMMLRNEKDCALLGGYLRNVTSVEATDDYTVVIKTEVPKATMLSINVPILPEHLWSAVEDDGMIKKVDMWDTKYFPNGPIGSGPLILDEYSKAGDFIRLLKFEDYHMGPVNVDEVLFKIYNTEDSLVTALQTGLIDVSMGIPATHWDATIADPDIEGQDISVLNMIDFGYNCASEELRTSTDDKGQPLFPKAATNLETNNMSVRKAIAMCIDKATIVDEAILGHADMGDSMVPTATPYWHYDVPDEEEFPFDIDAAAALLDAAGYVDTDADDIRENSTSGAELSFTFYYISQTNADQLAAERISKELEKIGINAPPIGVPEGQLYTMWFGLEYDLFIWNWQPDPDPSFILSVLTTDEIPEDSNDITAWSDVYYSNPVYDQLYLDQLSETNITKRQEIIHEMQRIAYFDVPYCILYYPHDLIAYRTDTFTNYPDMTTYPGKAPDWIWFYFEIYAVGATINIAPSEVSAGMDRVAVVDQTLSFTGDATDANDPVETLTWTWTFDDGVGEYTRTGQTVDYKFEAIGMVDVTLTVSDPGGLSSSDTLVVEVIEKPADSGWLYGYVKAPSGEAVVGAIVTAGDTTQLANLTGYYTICLVADDYTVTASKSGYSNASGTVTITADEVSWLNLTMSATSGSVKGYVYNSETSDPVSGATVTVKVGDNTKTFTSTSAGYFEFLNLPAGAYTINATKNGYESNSTSVTVVAGEIATASIYLDPAEDAETGGLSTAAIAAIALVIAIAAVAAAMMLMKRGKKGPSAAEEPPLENEPLGGEGSP